MTKLTPALVKAHEVKKLNSEHTRGTIFQLLKTVNEPVTSGEITGLLAQNGMTVDPNYVHTLLKKLVNNGLVSMRDETVAEREIRLRGRSNFGTGAHFTASYFWAGNGKSPRRTKHTDAIVPPVKMKRKVRKVYRPAVEVKKQTGPSREVTLLDRIAKLEDRISRLEKLIG